MYNLKWIYQLLLFVALVLGLLVRLEQETSVERKTRVVWQEETR
jgi:hypothetical protein